ncbi:uncharacterized protein LOC132901907 [Amyelois transitella]|uniref:uncharacterized protein LOC132901907 n=1 Tax=Amyelois transitella TaxID=680683 RepID=UPI00298FE959|nr:uncharacterized protein LOC132901907 [Amyelois transitella]
MFKQVFLVSTYCCQFDMNYFKENADGETNFISGMQITEALEVFVDGRKYKPGRNEIEGHVLLYVFDARDTITFLDNSMVITPSSQFDVNVHVWTIDSSDYVKDLSVESRGCILETISMGETIIIHVCVTAHDLRVDIHKQCSWERLICIHESIHKVLGNMKGVIADSDCYERCDYTQYDTDVKYTQQRRRFDEVSEGFAKINVHFGDNICMKYRREVLYTWDQVLANLGGIFGLCLGGSIISLIELIWLIFDLLLNAVRNFLTKNVNSRKNSEKKHQKLMKIKTISSKDFNSKYKFTH